MVKDVAEYAVIREGDEEAALKLCAKPADEDRLSKIEQVGAEAAVIEWMVQDFSPVAIVRRLNDMYPDTEFKTKDIEIFLTRNRNIVNAVVKSDKKLLQRHLDTNFAFRDKLLEMQEVTNKALMEAAGERDYSAISTLHNTILKNIQLFAKMGGLLEAENSTNIQINIGEQVAAAVANEHSGKKKDMLQKIQAVDVGFEIMEDDE